MKSIKKTLFLTQFFCTYLQIFPSFYFNFSAYEILFSDATTGSQLTQGATSLYGADWSTWTMTVGWAVQVCSCYYFMFS